MEDGNVNVMVEAKKEYTAQLCNIMCPFMIETFVATYNESENISKGKKVLLQFQRLLKDVPNWNDHMISEHNSRLLNNCSWFNDLLAAVFVSNVKILSSVRLKAQNTKISVKLPTNERFIHTCYINAAKDLYKDPYMFTDDTDDIDEILTKRFVTIIVNTVQEMLPVQEILRTYISQDSHTVEQVDVDQEEEYEEPEVEEEFEEPDTETEPLGGETVTGPEAEVGTEAIPTTEVEESKTVPINGGADVEEDVLFGDAPEEKPKV
tara:strand:+ start:779 stop:1570 length:792 start_codon:yes stop_codon:yes gene_type:complete